MPSTLIVPAGAESLVVHSQCGLAACARLPDVACSNCLWAKLGLSNKITAMNVNMSCYVFGRQSVLYSTKVTGHDRPVRDTILWASASSRLALMRESAPSTLQS